MSYKAVLTGSRISLKLVQDNTIKSFKSQKVEGRGPETPTNSHILDIAAFLLQPRFFHQKVTSRLELRLREHP